MLKIRVRIITYQIQIGNPKNPKELLFQFQKSIEQIKMSAKINPNKISILFCFPLNQLLFMINQL